MSYHYEIAHESVSASAMTHALIFITVLLSFVAIPQVSTGQPLTDPTTALDDYVNAPDPTYAFEVVGVESAGGLTQYKVEMKSQTWRAATEVINRTVWEHGLAIIVPDQLLHDTGMLIIAGGDNDGELISDEGAAAAATFARQTGSAVAILFQVPNQPLQFFDEPFDHSEDRLVAYTWDKAMNTGDYGWPAYLPMVKSAVRAMDTMQALVPAISQFVVTGFSKRGATTWLTGVVDARVWAIAPGVFDILNFAPQTKHHLSVYGCIAPALDDYVNYQILQRSDTPEGEALRQVVDPYSYRDRLMLPKFIINSSGDQFYPSDAARFYWDDLAGEKHLRYVPNSDHSLSNSETSFANTTTGLLSWYRTLLFDTGRPVISWSVDEAGTLTVTTSPPAPSAQLWQATNPTARDFRLETIGEAWTSTQISSSGDGTYAVQVPEPAEGWTAYFVEVSYPNGFSQVYTTQIFVTPDVLPFANTTEVTICAENTTSSTQSGVYKSTGPGPGVSQARAGNILRKFELEQNHPNPFNPETEIRFQLSEARHVVLRIFNVLGEEIQTLTNGKYEAGSHRIRWNGKDKAGKHVPSGVYLYEIRAGSFSRVKKMTLLR